jgi:DNA-binding FrmR family transcriptional regulator
MKMKQVHPELEKKALTIRLRKIKGQIEGVRKMVESSADCSDVLMQVVSARRALKSLGDKIIESHLYACTESFPSQSEHRRNLRSLLTVLERYVA